MYSTYYFSSAEEVDSSIIDAIKAAYKSKPIIITVEESTDVLNDVQKAILDERLNEDASTYISGKDSLDQLKKKHEL